MEIISKIDRKSLDALFSAFQINQFTDNEWNFIQEYVKLMSPLAKTVDYLQSDSILLGAVIPTINDTINLIAKITDLKDCEPLQTAVINGIKDRVPDVSNICNNICAFFY